MGVMRDCLGAGVPAECVEMLLTGALHLAQGDEPELDSVQEIFEAPKDAAQHSSTGVKQHNQMRVKCE